MIPKILHLCWLSGDEYPENISKCIKSWEQLLPDYEIKVWSKDTFDINSIQWVKEAYNAKKYAFAADYIRFWSLYHYGGIYLDSDVEVVKSFNDLLNEKSFMGFEYLNIPEAATIGTEPGMEWIKRCLDYYNGRSFYDENGNMRISPVPYLVRIVINEIYNNDYRDSGKIQDLGDLKLYPYYYFSPKNFYSEEIEESQDTYSIHRFASAWGPKVKRRWVMYFHRLVISIIGKKLHDKIYRSIIGYPEDFNGVKYSDF